VVPDITIWEAAAPPETLKFISIVICISLPIVIGYTIFVYSLFKGKVTDKEDLY
jgi:cytochrome d ubiquinol oxidase subunit II